MPNESYSITWIPETEEIGVGQFYADIEYKYLVPVIVGWSEKSETIQHAIAISIISLEVTTTFSTQYLGTTFAETLTTETKLDYSFTLLLFGLVAVFGIVVIILVKRRIQPSSKAIPLVRHQS